VQAFYPAKDKIAQHLQPTKRQTVISSAARDLSSSSSGAPKEFRPSVEMTNDGLGEFSL
jgi:hypothetical protein